MVNQTPVKDTSPRWKGENLKLLLCPVLLLAGTACNVIQPLPPPLRSFTTADLVIDPNLLSTEWETIEDANPLPAHVVGMHNNLGATHTRLEAPDSNADQIVAIFPSRQDAARAFNDNDFTGDTQGKFARTWKSPSNFTYDSPLAEQFHVMCVEIKNKAELGEIGEICAVEAQYEEFVSILIYRTSNPAKINAELELLSKADDTRIAEFLEHE